MKKRKIIGPASGEKISEGIKEFWENQGDISGDPEGRYNFGFGTMNIAEVNELYDNLFERDDALNRDIKLMSGILNNNYI